MFLELTMTIALLPLLPLASCIVILATRLGGRRPTETFSYHVVQAALLGSLALTCLQLLLVIAGPGPGLVDLGAVFALEHDRFELIFARDLLGLVYSTFSWLLLVLVAAFSRRYLHREPGFHRFYALLALLASGLAFVSLAGNVDVLLVGWEAVGFSSMLLIAFFNQRPAPVRHALRAFVTYRSCDTGLILAMVLLHVATGHADFVPDHDLPWFTLAMHGASPAVALAVALALVLASMGKSAQVPFSGWLPRAMEGPTPSSAVFYGALSVHLGPLMLMRMAPLLEAVPVARVLIVLIGALTALHGASCASVQSDIKSRLAYGSVTQVGLIFVEVGLGLYGLALAHCVGHAGFRTLQILRAPNLLHDRGRLESMLGHHVSKHLDEGPRWLSSPTRYRLVLDRWDLDALVNDRLIGSLLNGLRSLDALEQRLSRTLAQRLLPSSTPASQSQDMNKETAGAR